MGELPAGWALARIEEVSEDSVATLGPSGEGTFTYVQISSVDRERKAVTHPEELPIAQAPSRAKQILRSGDVLVSLTRPNLNAVALVGQDLDGAVASTGFHVIRPVGVDPKLPFLAVQSPAFVSHATGLVQGVMYPAIRPRDVLEYELPIPPLPEQGRIVAKIEELFSDLDAGVASLEQAQAKLERYRASVLKAAVEGKLTEQWRQENPPEETGEELLQRILSERRKRWEEEELTKYEAKRKKPPKGWKEKYNEPKRSETDGLTESLPGWSWAPFEVLIPSNKTGMKTGPFGTLLKKHEHCERGVPVLGIENIQPMRFLWGSKIHISDEKAVELSGYDVIPGDLMISRSGTVGQVCTVPEIGGKMRFSTNLMRVRFLPGVIEPDFVALLLTGSPFLLGQIKDLCKGTTRAFLNQRILSRLILPMPPLAEQRQILAEVSRHLSVVERSRSLLEAVALRGSRLRRATLRMAFQGKLVPQDPNDEPASVLLERIRAFKGAGNLQESLDL